MSRLSDLRREYARAGLREEDVDPDPFRQFHLWFDEAKADGLLEPNAMTLATVDADGRPTARTVLLKELDDRGFVFFTNYESKKGSDIAANPRVALVFPWLALERQITVTGDAAKIAREETDAYFRQRPRGSRIGAWASQQSRTISGRGELEARFAELSERYPGDDIPTPPHWGGYRVVPLTIELWQGRESRVHDRIAYVREPDGSWRRERRQP